MSPNDFGKFTVEGCKKISVGEYLRDFRRKVKEMVIESAIEVAQKPIQLATSKTGFGGIRYWFKCPLCSGRVGTLFIHPLSQQVGCRVCLGLDYRKRRFKGMAENETI